MDPGDDQPPEVYGIEDDEVVDMTMFESSSTDSGTRGHKRSGAPVSEDKFYTKYRAMYDDARKHPQFWKSGSITGRKRTFPQTFDSWETKKQRDFVHGLYLEYQATGDTVRGSLKRNIEDVQAEYDSSQLQRNQAKEEMTLALNEEVSVTSEGFLRGHPRQKPP